MVDTPFVAALNGGRSRTEHPGVPLSPAELAADAAKVLAAGAGEVHVHPRRPGGAESLTPTDVSAVVQAIRRQVPGMAVSLTTGGWIEPDPIRRRDQVSDWTTVPDTATVNVHEDGALEVARALHKRGVGVEAGLFTITAAEEWVNGPMRELAVRILIEPVERPAMLAMHDAEMILALLDRHRVSQPRLLHGDGDNAWHVLGMAFRLGIPGRIGLEDTTQLPDGRRASDNAALVRAALAGRSGGVRAPHAR